MAPINAINKPGQDNSLAGKALEVAQTQVGQREQPAGSNCGPMVDEYLAAVGLSPGYAWCLAFVYWCYATASRMKGVANPMVCTAGVHDCWNRSPKETKLCKSEAVKTPELIKPGDQFILFSGPTTGHTGFVEKVVRLDEQNGEQWIMHTIEGNSNNTGSREGNAVVRHRRTLTDKALQGFLQYTHQAYKQ